MQVVIELEHLHQASLEAAGIVLAGLGGLQKSDPDWEPFHAEAARIIRREVLGRSKGGMAVIRGNP